MKKTVYMTICLFLLCALLAGCDTPSAPENSDKAPENAGAVKHVEQGDIEYDIPGDWSKSDMSTESVYLYVSDNTDIAAEPSNVTVEVQYTGTESPSFEELEGANMFDEEMVRQILSPQQPENVTIDPSFTVPSGGVFQASYTLSAGAGKEVKQVLYLPVVDDYAILVYATDFGDDVTPSVQEVAKLIVGTLKLPE
jgi:hypothetical protein